MSKSENYKPFKSTQSMPNTKPKFFSNFQSKHILKKTSPLTARMNSNPIRENVSSFNVSPKVDCQPTKIEDIQPIEEKNDDFDFFVESSSQKQKEINRYLKDDDEEVFEKYLSQSVFKRDSKTVIAPKEATPKTSKSEDSWKTVSVDKFSKEPRIINHAKEQKTIELRNQPEQLKMEEIDSSASSTILDNSQLYPALNQINEKVNKKTYDILTSSHSIKTTTSSFGGLSMDGIDQLFSVGQTRIDVIDNNDNKVDIEEEDDWELEDALRDTNPNKENTELFDEKKDTIEVDFPEGQLTRTYSSTSTTAVSDLELNELDKNLIERKQFQQTIQSIQELKSDSKEIDLPDRDSPTLGFIEDEILKDRKGVPFFKEINTNIIHFSQMDSEFKFGKPNCVEWEMVSYSKESFQVNKIKYSIYISICGKSAFFVAVKSPKPDLCPLKVEIGEYVLLCNDPPLFFVRDYSVIESKRFNSSPISLKILYSNYIDNVKMILSKTIGHANDIVDVKCECYESIILDCRLIIILSFDIPDTLWNEVAAVVEQDNKGYIFIFPKNVWGYINEHLWEERKKMKGNYLRDGFVSERIGAVPIYRFECLI